MKHLLIVTYSGDMQGTTLEKKLKDYVYNTFHNSVCSEDAAEAIAEDICKECNKLAEANPKCKKPEIELMSRAYSRDGYYIRIVSNDPNRNNGLLHLTTAKTLYLTPYETLMSAIDDITEI